MGGTVMRRIVMGELGVAVENITMRARILGVVAGGALIGLTACSHKKEETETARRDGPPPAVLVGDYWMDHEEMGPPPPGYEKIVGEAMPNWEPGGLGLAIDEIKIKNKKREKKGEKILGIKRQNVKRKH
eukprot:TRINITY_DN82287_c0_g1_i1.p2 TRINITY_DN82287_c0_g1~~TRINITY_DN82287_c0_g1_i1.p2  ORF type:complete len:130 (-),score=15.42 TRINITY_DN82287_c0_g1_i1:1-390(-)